MKRAPFWVIAALIALAAAALTLWLSPAPPASPSDSTDQQHASRSRPGGRSRLAASRADRPAEQVEHPRIAALAPGIAQIIRDLGCARLIVGRHSSDDWTDQTVPVCNDQQSIDYERLITARPTHVLLQWGERDLPERLESLADQYGWTLVSYPLLTLDDIAQAVTAISGSVGRDELRALRAQDRALTPRTPGSQQPSVSYELERAPAALAEQLERSLAYDASLDGAGCVLLLYQGAGEGAVSRPAALGPGSYSHDLMLRIGGRSATPSGKPFMPLDAEDIAMLSPDAIVIVRPRRADTPGPAAGATTDELARSLGAAARLDIPAVKSGRIALIDDTMALVPGTNLTDFADRLRAILKGWAGEPTGASPAR